MRDKRWFRLLVFLPVLLGIMLTNYLVDPGSVYKGDSRLMADSLLAGNQVYFSAGNGNEREFKRCLIMGMPDEVDCVAVGPSLVFGVRTDMTGEDTFYNLGVSNASFYDIFAQFGLMEACGKHCGRVIFCVDFNFFAGTGADTGSRSGTLKPYADYMTAILEGEEAETPKEDSFARIREKLSQILSVSYFQSCVSWAGERGVDALRERIMEKKDWGIAGEGHRENYYLTDASLVYALSYQENPPEFVRKEAAEYDIETRFSRKGHIDPYCAEMFEKLTAYLTGQGVEVELYLCPLSPSLWDRVDNGEYYVLTELEEYAREIARKYDLKLTGTYDPYTLGMSDADFYDSRHVRHEVMEDYFDFTAK